MEIKSVRLSKQIRDDVIQAMLAAWVENNKAPYDLVKEEQAVGDKLYKDSYPKLDVSTVPRDMLQMDTEISIAINGVVSNYQMSENRPVRKQNYYSQIPSKNYKTKPAIVKTYENRHEKHNDWVRERKSFTDEITQIIYSVNTTKQLVELWPEAEQYLPAYANDPSKGINLPALKTSRLNAMLGINEK